MVFLLGKRCLGVKKGDFYIKFYRGEYKILLND